MLGFLRFNAHPAAVFMGDTGSLPLGALLGLVAIVLRQEIILVVIAGVLVVETLSVLVQVTYFRWTQRRVFLCAPLHHHYQLLGWPEKKIVKRFWQASAGCALAGLLLAVSVVPRIGSADRQPVQLGEVRVEMASEPGGGKRPPQSVESKQKFPKNSPAVAQDPQKNAELF